MKARRAPALVGVLARVVPQLSRTQWVGGVGVVVVGVVVVVGKGGGYTY